MDNKNKVDIDISLQDPAWEKLGGVEKIVEESVNLTLETAILPKIVFGRDTEVSVVLANDDLLKVLNREYRSKDKETNILTFAALDAEEPASEGPLNLGDIFLSFETVMEEATDEGKFIMDHVRHLVVHGVLHLLGYDHTNDSDATDMETLEIRILERMNVQNPYTMTEI